jgi:hypothetical protein
MPSQPSAPRRGSSPGRRPVPEPDPRAGGVVGRFLLDARGRWAAMVRVAGRRALGAATGEAGRRLARTVALTVVLAVLVTTLYDRGEVPSAAAQPVLRSPATAGTPAASGRDAARRKDPGGVGGLRGRERPSPVGERPAAVAAAWYAARQGVPRAKVKPLQQDRVSAREVRVLVLADHGRGRLRTALVRVRLGRDGWRVR